MRGALRALLLRRDDCHRPDPDRLRARATPLC
jgi:hypothetical protein